MIAYVQAVVALVVMVQVVGETSRFDFHRG
jgi:hypothetical protein